MKYFKTVCKSRLFKYRNGV